MADPRALFGLFVSCVVGQPVTRYGTGTMIGASRTKDDPTVVQYDPTLIVGIPHAELSKHRRAYDRAIQNGSLSVRTAAEYSAQERQQEEAKRVARQKKEERLKAEAEARTKAEAEERAKAEAEAKAAAEQAAADQAAKAEHRAKKAEAKAAADAKAAREEAAPARLDLSDAAP